jgi:putrescine aminotransferase
VSFKREKEVNKLSTKVSTRLEELRTRSQAHVFQVFTIPGAPPEMIVEKGKGVYVTDVAGKEYMDFCSMFQCSSLGYGRDDIAEVAYEQMRKLSYWVTIGLYSHIPAIEYAEALAGFTPKNIKHFFFCNSGSESTETALKLAYAYWYYQGKATKTKVISLMEGYHGLTHGVKSLLGDYPLRAAFGPDAPGVIRIPNYNCYRCHLERTYPDCGIACAKYLEQAIVEEGEDSVAAFIAEPIHGYGGIISPVPEYFPIVRDICSRHNVLYIDDEVITGFCRTGANFCVDHWNVQPDLMTMAKGLAAVYFPVAAIGISDKVNDVLKDKFVMGGFTTSGHPVGMVVAKKVLEIYQQEKTAEHVAKVGQHIEDRLGKEFMALPNVGNVGGKGFLQAIEIVADKESKRRFPIEMDVTHNIVLPKCWEKGLIPRVYSALRHDRVAVAPPLIATQKEVDKGLDILYEVIAGLKDIRA